MVQTISGAIPEVARSVMRAISRASAGSGNGVSGLIDKAFASLVRKRQVRWHRRFAQAVAEIGRRTDESALAALCSNEHFLTLSLEAAQIAWHTHHEEKLQALKWAVIRSALPGAPDEQLQFMYLRYIDELAPVHLVVLAALDRPSRWMDEHSITWARWRCGTVSSLIQYCVPVLRGRPEAVEQVVRELQVRGLVEPGNYLRAPEKEAGLLNSRTTDFGRMFLAFIDADQPVQSS